MNRPLRLALACATSLPLLLVATSSLSDDACDDRCSQKEDACFARCEKADDPNACEEACDAAAAACYDACGS